MIDILVAFVCAVAGVMVQDMGRTIDNATQAVLFYSKFCRVAASLYHGVPPYDGSSTDHPAWPKVTICTKDADTGDTTRVPGKLPWQRLLMSTGGPEKVGGLGLPLYLYDRTRDCRMRSACARMRPDS